MNIAVIGVGGVGGYFGGKLTKLIDFDQDLHIFFVARNQHLKEIQKNGLILNTLEEGEIICKPTLATDNINELPQIDLVLLCVKSFDLEAILHALQLKIKPDTVIIPLLNGVDIYKRIRRKLDMAYVYPACAFVGTHIERYGKVTQRGGSCSILLGPDPLYKGYKNQNILNLFKNAQINYDWYDDSYPKIWEKYIFIAAFALVTAGMNKTVGEVVESKELGNDVKSIMKEIHSIAHKKSIVLADEIVEKSFETASHFPYNAKTSFQRDFENPNKHDERDLYGDTIIRLGKEEGIDTKTTQFYNDKLESLKARS